VSKQKSTGGGRKASAVRGHLGGAKKAITKLEPNLRAALRLEKGSEKKTPSKRGNLESKKPGGKTDAPGALARSLKKRRRIRGGGNVTYKKRESGGTGEEEEKGPLIAEERKKGAARKGENSPELS